MNTLSLRWFLIAVFISGCIPLCAPGYSQDATESATSVEPMMLTLVPADLNQANSSMIKFDRNDDGQIDREEWNRLQWDEEKVRRFDVNRDGKLTHVEMALHFAASRISDGIEPADSKFAEKMMLRYDKNKNGRLDPSEIERQNWPPDAEEFDKDSDGSITLTEIMKEFAYRRGLRRELGILSIDSNNANRLLREHDKDRDGKLNEDEAVAADMKVSDADHDEDGRLDSIEVATVFAKRRMDNDISPADQYQAQNLFRMLDRDDDGQLSSEELSQPSLEGYRKADKNGDGNVTERELQAHFASGRKEKGYSQSHLVAARRVMLRYDADKNGTLSEAEYSDRSEGAASARTEFAKIDGNSDKQLTLEELAKHLAKT